MEPDADWQTHSISTMMNIDDESSVEDDNGSGSIRTSRSPNNKRIPLAGAGWLRAAARVVPKRNHGDRSYDGLE